MARDVQKLGQVDRPALSKGLIYSTVVHTVHSIQYILRTRPMTQLLSLFIQALGLAVQCTAPL